MRDVEADVGVEDIVSFYIKINDSERARSDISRLSTKDKVTAFTLIANSSADRNFKVDIARHFVNDSDAHLRRKAELLLEDLVPGWVVDPTSSILQVLRSAEHKGLARRNAAVRFLFGIVDADSLRITLTSLLSSSNRAHTGEILSILDQYIESSQDEQEQVKIFNACLDMVLSDEIDMQAKHHASNLLSVFFKKVASTSLGSHLKTKYMEKQVEKGESVYRFICNGSCGLTMGYLKDLLGPLQESNRLYQIKILTYFAFLLDKTWDESEVDNYIDTWPNSWEGSQDNQEEKLQKIRKIIVGEAEALWPLTDDDGVKDKIMAVVFSGHQTKEKLLANIASRLESGKLSDNTSEQISRLLTCFIKSDLPQAVKLRAVELQKQLS